MTQHIYGGMILALNLWIVRKVYKMDIKIQVMEVTIEFIKSYICPKKEE